LKISLIVQAAQPQSGQILIIAPNPQRHLRQFISEVKAILDAFKQAWLWPQRQILRCDVTLRCLYSSTSEHAFQEIWEKRLCRQPDSLTILDRPVHGGGLRFVMPPQLGDPDSAQIELKIESWLRDPKKIFVEVQFLWHQPKPAGTDFAPADRLNRADDYIKRQVHAFMMKGES
jgi:hypothetical protein